MVLFYTILSFFALTKSSFVIHCKGNDSPHVLFSRCPFSSEDGPGDIAVNVSGVGVMAERNPFYFWERQTAASVAADHHEEAHLFLIHLKCALYLSRHSLLPPPQSRVVPRTKILRPPLKRIQKYQMVLFWNRGIRPNIALPGHLCYECRVQFVFIFCFLFVCFRRPGVRPNIVLQRSPLLWTQGTICFCFLFVCFRRPGVRPNIVLQGHLCYECRDTERFCVEDLEHVTIQLN